MRFRSFVYPLLLIYELLRLCFLLQGGAQGGVSALPLTWYAAVPLLCIAPVMFFMLSFSETEYAAWLPLISLIKALGLPALFLYVARTTPTALRFGTAENFTLFGTVAMTALIGILDCAVGIFCFGRNRKLCK